MKASLVTLLCGFSMLTISCAHKAKDVHASEVKVEKKAEVKIEKKAEKNQLAYTCLVGKDKRTVILDKKEKRCEVQYKKFGDEQEVAWAESTPAVCDRAFNSIRTNIESSGYQCADGLDIKFDKKTKEADQVKKPVETAANHTK